MTKTLDTTRVRKVIIKLCNTYEFIITNYISGIYQNPDNDFRVANFKNLESLGVYNNKLL